MKKKIRILAICGSPRKGGNTELLLKAAVDGAKSAGAQVTLVNLGRLNFAPCIECGGCDKTGICVLKDDLTSLYAKIIKADAIIVASPIFFGSLSAFTKAMIDRCQSFWVAKYVLHRSISKVKRPSLFLCVGAAQRMDFFQNAMGIIKNFFATIDAQLSGELFCPGVENKGDMNMKKALLAKSRSLGRALAAKAMKEDYHG